MRPGSRITTSVIPRCISASAAPNEKTPWRTSSQNNGSRKANSSNCWVSPSRRCTIGNKAGASRPARRGCCCEWRHGIPKWFWKRPWPEGFASGLDSRAGGRRAEPRFRPLPAATRPAVQRHARSAFAFRSVPTANRNRPASQSTSPRWCQRSAPAARRCRP